jgi:hypothetical protein
LKTIDDEIEGLLNLKNYVTCPNATKAIIV